MELDKILDHPNILLQSFQGASVDLSTLETLKGERRYLASATGEEPAMFGFQLSDDIHLQIKMKLSNNKNTHLPTRDSGRHNSVNLLPATSKTRKLSMGIHEGR